MPHAIINTKLEWNSRTPSYVIRDLASDPRVARLADFDSIKQPVALIVGEHDLVTPREGTVAVYKSMSKAKGRVHGPYIIPDAAHSVFAEKNELVNALITAFVQKKCKLEVGVGALPSGKLRNFNNKPKWALKNYSKWKATLPIGTMIGDGICGCKVLRQDDPTHSPDTFNQNSPNIGLVIDVSRETPPYIMAELAACKYVKVATASKICPTPENVAEFIGVILKFREDEANRGKDVAVHCHYGFNRTGFMVASYVILVVKKKRMFAGWVFFLISFGSPHVLRAHMGVCDASHVWRAKRYRIDRLGVGLLNGSVRYLIECLGFSVGGAVEASNNNSNNNAAG